MTIDTDTRPDNEIEQRVVEALQVLARAGVPDELGPVASLRRARWRPLVAAAAVVLVVAGVVAIAVTQRRSSSPADLVPAGPPATVLSTESATTDTAGEDDPVIADGAGQAAVADLGIAAILDPAFGEGPATTLGPVDRWLFAVEATNYAVRGEPDGSVASVSWRQAPESEWSKSFHDQPDVALPGGVTAKRLRPTAVDDVVVYALQRNGGVFTATIPLTMEESLAAWFADAANTPIDAVEPPDGFIALASEVDQRGIDYATGVSVFTRTYEAPIDLEDHLAATARGAVVEVLTSPDTFLVTAPNDPNHPVPFVVWHPRGDIIVELMGPAERLPSLSAHLRLTTLPDPEIANRPNPSGVDIDDAEVELLGETSLGRFAYVRKTTDEGTCVMFDHTGIGGSSSCTEESVPDDPAVCGSGWNAPDVIVAGAFVIGVTQPEFEFTIDGSPVLPKIETGVIDGISWTMASIREAGHADSALQTVTVSVDQVPC